MKSIKKWVKVVERRGQSILISSYFYNGIQTKFFKKTLGLNLGLDHYLIVDYSNYYLELEVKNFQTQIERIFKETEFRYVKIALHKLIKKGEQLLKYSENINKIKNHVGAFEKFSKLCLEFGPAMYFPILIEKILEEEAVSIIRKHIKKNPDKYFSILTASTIPTEGTKELISLYKIALAYYKNSKKIDKNIEKMINLHLNRFCWLSFTKFVGKPWNKESITQRIKKLNLKSIAKDLDELKNKSNTSNRLLKKTYENLKFPNKEIQFMKLTQLLAYFRTYRIDVYTQAGSNAKHLFELLAQKIELTVQQFVFLTYEEILLYLKNKQKFPKNEVKRRSAKKWQLLFSEGKMTLSYERPFLVEDKQNIKRRIIKGQIASEGFATGEVKIIRGVLEFNKMKNKAVLVTSMTTPDFVPLMQRASAIITDEGGITCHAAIVSRELKKPCIIGTKIATKIFKDGDLVEVDANKGIVKIIEKVK